MKPLILALFLIPSLPEYSTLAHLPGYYYNTGDHYRFKPCYKDESRYLVLKDDIALIVDHLNEKYDTKLKLTATPNIKIWSSIIRKDGVFNELAIVGITHDGFNYIIEVFYRKAKI